MPLRTSHIPCLAHPFQKKAPLSLVFQERERFFYKKTWCKQFSHHKEASALPYSFDDKGIELSPLFFDDHGLAIAYIY